MKVALREISEAAAFDPKAGILKYVGDLGNFEVFHNLVLVGTYIRPAKMMKGPNGEDIAFHYTDKTLAEDRFQGKAALVLKVGPLAFVDDGHIKFGGMTVTPGDWVIVRPSDGLEMFTGDSKSGATVRLIEDAHIKGRIKDPSVIY